MKAVLLCAGHGTRLGELCRDTPKPMLPVGPRPLAEYALLNLVRHGFDEVAINLHYHPEQVRGYFGDGSRWGVRITYFDEPELLGTAGAVRNMGGWLGDDPFLVHYGDVLTDQDYSALARFHARTEAAVTLLVHRRAKSNSVVSLGDGGRVIRFLERPGDDERRGVVSPWVFSGVALCGPEMLGRIPTAGPCDLPRDVFAPAVEAVPMYGFPLTGFRIAVDSPDRLAAARAADADGRVGVGPGPTASDDPWAGGVD